MEHHAQALLALSITSVLCLAAWIWARRRLIRFQASVDGHDTDVIRSRLKTQSDRLFTPPRP